MSFNIGEELEALLLVVFMAIVGATAFALTAGYVFPRVGKIFKGFKLKPLLKKVRLPPVLAMILMGCISRNFFGSVTKAFPENWA